jgi:hypothetical protein
MNNFLKSATPRIVGCIGVVSLLGILKWIFGDEFGIAMFILILPFIVVGVLAAFAGLIEMIFTGGMAKQE